MGGTTRRDLSWARLKVETRLVTVDAETGRVLSEAEIDAIQAAQCRAEVARLRASGEVCRDGWVKRYDDPSLPVALRKHASVIRFQRKVSA